MKLITDNAQLCAFIPNVFSPGIGETDLYTKITASIRTAEAWFDRYVLPMDETILHNFEADALHPDNLNLVKEAIVCHAFHGAVDSLDLVLTDNGFGIVSNDTIAPASKERVANLKERLIKQRDAAIRLLLLNLDETNWWPESIAAEKFKKSIVHFGSLFMNESQTFEQWLSQQAAYTALEMQLNNQFISYPLYDYLRKTPTVQMNNNVTYLYNSLGSLERDIVEGRTTIARSRFRLIGLVNFIRTATETGGIPERVFDLWRNSPTAKLYEDHRFQNSKQSGGVWL